VHKGAREQFEMRIHKRIVDILDPNAKTIEALTSLNLPAGVDVEIKM
jgi:small subunit ribosomal protein S10